MYVCNLHQYLDRSATATREINKTIIDNANEYHLWRQNLENRENFAKVYLTAARVSHASRSADPNRNPLIGSTPSGLPTGAILKSSRPQSFELQLSECRKSRFVLNK